MIRLSRLTSYKEGILSYKKAKLSDKALARAIATAARDFIPSLPCYIATLFASSFYLSKTPKSFIEAKNETYKDLPLYPSFNISKFNVLSPHKYKIGDAMFKL